MRRLGRGLAGLDRVPGRRVQGTSNKEQIAAAVEKAGARLVNGPFPGTDYYVHGDWCRGADDRAARAPGRAAAARGELEGI